MSYQFRAVRFNFADDLTWDGYTDDSTWNGFLNVWVDEEVHDLIRREYATCLEDDETIWSIEPDSDGLISYAGGFATTEDYEEEEYSTALCKDCHTTHAPTSIGTVCRVCGRGMVEGYEEPLQHSLDLRAALVDIATTSLKVKT